MSGKEIECYMEMSPVLSFLPLIPVCVCSSLTLTKVSYCCTKVSLVGHGRIFSHYSCTLLSTQSGAIAYGLLN